MHMRHQAFLKAISVPIALALLTLSQGAGAVPLTTTTYDSGGLDFATVDQSMWDSGDATILQGSPFFGENWTNSTASFGPGFIGGIESTAIPTNPAWYAWKLCPFLCGGEPARNDEIITVDLRSG